MYKKSNSYIRTKYVPIGQNLHKVQTEKSLKLEMYVLLFTNNVQVIQNYTKANCFWTRSIKKTSFQTFYDILYMCKNII